MDFIPEPQFTARETPYFEDSHANEIAGWRARKEIDEYQSDVAKAISKLGGLVTGITPGMYGNRYGYRINFALSGNPGRVDVAALPIRTETKLKKAQALKQALYLFWKELDAATDSWAYKPNSQPLIPYLIGPGGKTVAETLIERGILPDIKPAGYLPAPKGR